MAQLPNPQLNPVVDGSGRLTREWLLPFQQIINSLAQTTSNTADIAALQAEIDAIPTVSTSGIVVSVSGNLTTRTLIAGANITLTNPDGTGGDITIEATGVTDIPSLVLYDDTGRALFDENGLELDDGA